MIEVQYDVATREIVGYGQFPGGTADETMAIASIDDAEVPKLHEPGTKYLEPDNTIRVVPTGPPGPTQQAFAAAEDTERLRLINDRSRTDPAYAALADFVVRGVQR